MARHVWLSLPDDVHDALRRRAEHEQVSVGHVVRQLLAEQLDVEHHSLLQVSTSGALVEGVNDGCVTVADLKRHGDFGVGTFEGLDGEMVLLDGTCYQARGDGRVAVAPDHTLTPFAVVTRFAADRVLDIGEVASLDRLLVRLDDERSTDNLFVGVRARAAFSSISLRAACRTELGTPLVEATHHQEEWTLTGVRGTLVGFWSPPYSRAVAVPGHHLHFVSDDRTQAGHVLALRSAALRAEVHEMNDVHLALPESESFVRADLSRDPSADLDVAEHERR